MQRITLLFIFMFYGLLAQGATFFVTNTNSSGPGSLAQAILDANGSPGADVIEIQVAGTLNLIGSLPGITETVTIDGTTAPGYAGAPVFAIDGSAAAAGNGLNISGLAAAGTIIQGLNIQGFSAFGLAVTNTEGVELYGNYIGTDLGGTVAMPNSNGGVLMDNVDNAIIGGNGPNQQNLVSGNGGTGFLIQNGSSGNSIVNNIIGTDITGSVDLGNTFHGISLGPNSDSNIVDGNLVSGNGEVGIFINNGSDSNVVINNIVGLDITGSFSIGNTQFGISVIANSNNNLIGQPGAGNIVSGNGNPATAAQSNGINIDGSIGNVLQGNFVGTDITGTIAIGNEENGIAILNSPNTVIGGSGPGEGNLVSGNGYHGIVVFQSNDVVVQGNIVGADNTGTSPLGNGTNAGGAPAPAVFSSSGIIVIASMNTIIGGSSSGAGNIFAASALEYGVFLVNADNSTIWGNAIGTDFSGTVDLGNALGGIFLVSGSAGNTIGGINVGEGNIIANNNGPGVDFDDALSSQNPIIANQMYCNTGVGINLNSAGNGNNPAPVISSFTSCEASGTSGANNLIHLYYDTNCNGSGGSGCQGDLFIGVVSADNLGNWTYPGPLNDAFTLAATATHQGPAPGSVNNTSEFACLAAVYTAPASELQPETCPGYLDGAAEVVITGGSLPYVFSWSNGETASIISNVASGVYSVSVSEGGGCIVVSTVLITASASLSQASGNGIGTATDIEAACMQVPVNGGNPFSEVLDNSCVPPLNPAVNGLLSDNSLTVLRAPCSGALTFDNAPVTYTLEASPVGGSMDVVIGTPSSGNITNVESAIYGPVNIACPILSGGTFLDCNTGDGTSDVVLSFVSNPGDVYILLVDTEGTGVFNISNTIFPLELIEFNVEEFNTANKVFWTTASEKNTNFHVVESSEDGLQFKEVGRVKAAGSSFVNIEYEFLDNNPALKNYYRLRTIDNDGVENLSKVVVVEREKPLPGFQVYPNPSLGELSLGFYNNEDSDVSFEFVDVAGRELLSFEQHVKEGFWKKDFDFRSFSKGVYFLTIKMNKESFTQKIILQ